jgi:hypothetical protein
MTGVQRHRMRMYDKMVLFGHEKIVCGNLDESRRDQGLCVSGAERGRRASVHQENSARPPPPMR